MAKEITYTDQPVQLFRNIALTFSGGGYRAATFSLGVLSYLNQVLFKGEPLLKNVQGLSTVSGGTLTGATYAYFLSKNKDFKTFYTHFYKTLDNDQLLGMALEKLDSDKLWKDSHKKRSLINAFALSYAELLTNGHFKDLKKSKSHLKDICFNATDFSFGLAFRFQTTGQFGNYRLHTPLLRQLSEEMKIADAIASSSCFPTGFEPMVMPDDFISNHQSEKYKALKANKNFKDGVGIMDGGIVDNQGIGSIMNADKRRKEGDKYDLFMVCDVGSYFMEPWEPSDINMNKKGWAKTPKQIYNLIVKKLNRSWWLWLSLAISIVLLYFGFKKDPGTWCLITGGAAAMISILCIALKFTIANLEHKVSFYWRKLMNIIPAFIRDKLFHFENLRIRLIMRMIEERGTSSIKMISEIFLKQMRRLNYDLFYKDENLKNRRITALIYELTKDQYKYGKSDEKGMEAEYEEIPDPGNPIFKAAQIATEMGTTLWFTKEDREVERMKNLVSCGQFTACYNLLKYCIDLKKLNMETDDPGLLDEMIKKFNTDWKAFIKDPYWLHDLLL